MSQQDQHQVPIYDAELESAAQVEEKQRLKDSFAAMERNQPEFLDEAGKSIIERIATFLAILFAVTAFSGNFPPKYLVGNPWAKYLVIAIMLCYLLAMAMGIWAIQPRSYDLHRYNVSGMRKEWERIIARKQFWVRAAGILFALGTAALAGLIISIIWNV
jgi:hypothetical protein